MIKYLVFILVVMFSQIKGGEIIHTETHKNGGIKLISYHKKVDGGMGISLLKKETYHLNGQKELEENYKDGEKDRLWTLWYDNGKKKQEWNYKDGEEDGLGTSWYENGKKRSEWTSKDGKLISSKIWNKDGSVKE